MIFRKRRNVLYECMDKSAAHPLIPEDVTEIRERAFKNCKSMVSLIVPEGVTDIEASTFQDCSALETVVFLGKLNKIGMSAFSGCRNLRELVFCGGVKQIDAWAFANCESLVSLAFPEGLTRIGSKAFIGCKSLVSVLLPDSLEEIGQRTFDGCICLEVLSALPRKLWKIGAGAFADCGRLKKFRVAQDHPFFRFENGALYSADGTMLVAAPAADGDFVVPEGVKRIASFAFFGCSALKTLSVPHSMESIGMFAIGSGAFEGFCVPKDHPHFSACGRALYTADGKILLAYPNACGNAEIHAQTEEIAACAFYGDTELEAVVLPAGLKKISISAFADCTGLRYVFMPFDSVEVAADAFRGCTGVTYYEPPLSLVAESLGEEFLGGLFSGE